MEPRLYAIVIVRATTCETCLKTHSSTFSKLWLKMAFEQKQYYCALQRRGLSSDGSESMRQFYVNVVYIITQ